MMENKVECTGSFSETAVDAKLSAPSLQVGYGSRCIRKDAIEFAIRASAGRINSGANIVRDAQVIYDYIVNGAIPSVESKDSSSFTTTPKGKTP